MNFRSEILAVACIFILCKSYSLYGQEVLRMHTVNGIEFGLWRSGEIRSPAPILFILGSTIDEVLESEYFRQAGNSLGREHGWLCVSLDLPYHGKLREQDRPAELDGWAWAARNKVDFVTENNNRMKEILDFLVQRGDVDTSRIFACGTSRGGYLAFQFAAFDPRVKAVAGFAPVTNLLALREFSGISREELQPSLLLENHTGALSRKAVWLAIGDQDDRVGTDFAIAFARSLSKMRSPAPDSSAGIELNVMASKGHTTPPGAPRRAVAWFLNR